MISQLAKEDLQDLRDAGLHPTDEDVIRLHALACRLSDGEETTAACAPRHALCGGFVFWEPTLAAWDWYFYAKDHADDGEMLEWLFAYACLNGRSPGFLANLRDPMDIEHEVSKFLTKLTATKDEVTRAINYVTIGTDDVRPEKTELEKKRERESDRVKANSSAVEIRLRRAAASTGLSYDEIMMQTPSRLDGMIYEANILAGLPLTSSAARYHAEYLATLHAIRERLTRESAAITPAQ